MCSKSLANDLWIFHKVDSCKLNTRIQGKQEMCYSREHLSGRLEFQLCPLQCLANTGSCGWAHLSLSNRPVCSTSTLVSKVLEYSLPHYYFSVFLPHLPACPANASLFPVPYHGEAFTSSLQQLATQPWSHFFYPHFLFWHPSSIFPIANDVTGKPASQAYPVPDKGIIVSSQ